MYKINSVELLRKQQYDFIERLKYDCLLNCQTPGRNSEITVVSEQNKIINILRFSLSMYMKYKSSPQINIKTFKNNYIGKLGEEAVKSSLNELVTEVDYTIKKHGDNKVDFKLISDLSIGGIQVKTRNGIYNTVEWSISKEEIEKNNFLVCMLIQKEVTFKEIVENYKENKEHEYKIISAGFLPIDLIKTECKQEFTINELLYSSGLNAYLNKLIE
ncbi:hypothetical protein [Nostoc sp. UHCC 0251]|uniref:hypothetical protein n=1 Tax=Nostoc sp. UHCC 0251 TaxID=3110240 RepID=UPI002B1FD83E|nr:hypothetical protein [Nostoc sp. UHCC 0251]MEA5626394.1 hypothetical protein [Nostoc sp. UHCC 0251]